MLIPFSNISPPGHTHIPRPEKKKKKSPHQFYIYKDETRFWVFFFWGGGGGGGGGGGAGGGFLEGNKTLFHNQRNMCNIAMTTDPAAG